MSLPVIHIVRRFGRVGGMESYVWHLVHGLVDQDIQVTVICEQVCESPEASIRIVKVETSSARPRWKSMMTFRALVDQKIRDMFRGQTLLIHSHERSVCHQVTTFHGPPIEPPRGFGWLSRFNKRFTAWQQMELKELLGPNVQVILPVSSQVQQQLTKHFYGPGTKRLQMTEQQFTETWAVRLQHLLEKEVDHKHQQQMIL